MLDRNALFEDNLTWAANIARNVRRKLPASFDLDDLAQAARIELWRRCELYDPEKNDTFKGYAYLWVLNAVRMKTRRRAFREATHFSLQTGDRLGRESQLQARVERAIDPLPDPQQLLLAAESSQGCTQRSRLLRLIKMLPVETAYCVRRVYLNEVAPAAVAQCWGVTEAQVKRQLTAAVRAMKTAVSTSAPAKSTCKAGWLFLPSCSLRQIGSGKAEVV